VANNQPLNTDIYVKNRVRAYRQNYLHNSVKDMVDRMRPLVMSVVSLEQIVDETRDGGSDEHILSTSLIEGRGTNLPLVRVLRAVLNFSTAANDMYAEGEIDFPVQIGQDKFLQSPGKDRTVSADNTSLQADIQSQLRDVPGAPTRA